MCASKPKPPAPPVPLPEETSKAAAVDNEALMKRRKSGRSGLTIPASGGASTSGMSGLNIPG